MKIHELYTDSTRWTKKTFSRRRDGVPINPNSKEAYSFCLVGAAYRCYPGVEVSAIYNKLLSVLPDNIAQWNDDPVRTFDEVKALVVRLDI